MSFATGCICGKNMLTALNEGTCLWCGRGVCTAVREHAYGRNMAANTAPLPRPGVLIRRPAVWTEDACVLAYRRWEAEHHRAPRPLDWQQSLRDGERIRPAYGTVRKLFGGWPGFLSYIADIPREQAA